MSKSNVIIHYPNGLHSWGLEFNRGLEFSNDDATDFIELMNYESHTYKPNGVSVWFHQSGHGSTKGYQYYELWHDDQDYLFFLAMKIADSLGVVVQL